MSRWCPNLQLFEWPLTLLGFQGFQTLLAPRQEAAAGLQAQLGDAAAVVLASHADGKVAVAAAAGPGAVGVGLKAGAFVGALAKRFGGGGGGRPALATAGIKGGAALVSDVLADAERALAEALG